MRITTVFRRLLGVTQMIVEEVLFMTDGNLAIQVRPTWRRSRCATCSSKAPRYDRRPLRRWSHLPWGRTSVQLVYEPWRVNCPRCGIQVEKLPWAAQRSRFTYDFEELAAYLAQVTDRTQVAKMLGIAWETVGSIVQRVVARRIDPDRFSDLRRIGIDEFSYRKHHNYLTFVVDHDRRRVVWAGEGRSSTSLAPFFELLGPERSQRIESVTIDLSAAYIKAVREGLSQAELVFDRFHVQRLASDALDEVRRSLVRSLPPGSKAAAIKDSRFVLLKDPWNLTSGTGPWGSESWTYDRIGNRLTAAHSGGQTDQYRYATNSSGGNTAKLVEITSPAAVPKLLFYDAVGSQAYVSQGFSKTVRTFNAESRMSQQIYGAHSQASPLTTFRYDGRSFLKEARYRPLASRTDETVITTATYSSDGLLHQRQTTRNTGPADPRDFHPFTETISILHFAGRPVAQYRVLETTPAEQGQPPEVTTSLGYLTTDHLGTPVALTNEGGALLWQGGFSPFGEDYSGAEAAGVFLRFPGQWDDAAWAGGEEGYYNVHRWYQPGTGRYGRVDPLGAIRPGREVIFEANNSHSYSASNPLFFIDPMGLKVVIENPQTQKNYDQLKECFPFFRTLVENFEQARGPGLAGPGSGGEETWRIRDPVFSPPSCNALGLRSSPRTVWVPPGKSCEQTMKCLFHEFYELWLIGGGGFKQAGAAGPADRQARAGENWIPVQKCCGCSTRESRN